MDLAGSHPINALRIAWAAPYARRYVVQYWTGEDPIKQATKGTWVAFPGGSVENGAGGTAVLKLASSPMPVRFIRIWMTESSNTCDTHGSADRRNCVGYAIRELYLGTVSPDGKFHDLVRHTPDPDQTATICSSVDPWHEPSDVSEKTRPGRPRPVLHQRLYPRTPGNDSRRHALRHTRGLRRPDRLPESPRLSDFLYRNGRGA